MFPRARRVLTVRGIDVRVDPSWVIIALLVVWTFWQRFEVLHDHPTAVAVAMAVIAALLFFASVLAHELAHALEAKHRRIDVGAITLFLFGGVTETHVEAERPRDEFVMAAVGPYVSLVTGAVFGLIATAINDHTTGLAAVADVAGLLGWINVALALFNLLPGAPLDGGRVLRSALWAATGDRERAIRWSARAGQVLGAGLIAFGLWQILQVPGAVGNGFWFALIGWFMLQAARGELLQAELHRLLDGRTVESLLGADPPLIASDRPLSNVLDQLAADQTHDAFPVVDPRGEQVVGGLRMQDVKSVEPFDRTFRTAGDVMVPIGDIPPIPVDAPLEQLLREHRGDELVRVMRGRELWALLTPQQIGRALHRLRELERGPGLAARRSWIPGGRSS